MRAGTEREELTYMRREGQLSDEFNLYLDRNIDLIEKLDAKIFEQQGSQNSAGDLRFGNSTT